MAVHGKVIDSTGNLDLASCSLCHALLINRQCDHTSTVLHAQATDKVKLLLAILQVDGVDDGLATNPLQGGLDDRNLCGVDDDRTLCCRVESGDKLRHV